MRRHIFLCKLTNDMTADISDMCKYRECILREGGNNVCLNSWLIGNGVGIGNIRLAESVISEFRFVFL